MMGFAGALPIYRSVPGFRSAQSGLRTTGRSTSLFDIARARSAHAGTEELALDDGTTETQALSPAPHPPRKSAVPPPRCREAGQELPHRGVSRGAGWRDRAEAGQIR